MRYPSEPSRRRFIRIKLLRLSFRILFSICLRSRVATIPVAAILGCLVHCSIHSHLQVRQFLVLQRVGSLGPLVGLERAGGGSKKYLLFAGLAAHDPVPAAREVRV
eukprot:GHVT01044576.1.p1 GENE.GHVT01044576.1~~GHVT01044576.1.p1  ORF type:complete len:106 (-),score=1.70 GHVT01044576.1:582-899(-)